MKIFHLKDMKKGWFVGDFLPTCFRTKECEVAYRRFKKGDKEERHFHKIAIEITVIAEGRLKMNNVVYNASDIIFLDPGEAAECLALTDGATVVVKIPSVPGDKYLS